MRLLGRGGECEALDHLVAGAGAGRSGVTVLRGEAGVGKSALLNYLAEQVEGWHVARALGVESEMELDYSGLHQLCGPMLTRLDCLPVPQRNALAAVFGLSTGPAPDRFLVGVATLTLFAEVAELQPLVCIVDDAQWLDHTSALILGFVSRRLLAERIAVVAAARRGIGDDVLAGLPELPISGLADSDAYALLRANAPGKLDPAVRDQIVAESRGIPLALLELARTWQADDLAGEFGFPDGESVAGRIERSYAQRIRQLSPEGQLLVLTAAAEPLCDPVLLRRAADALGVNLTAANPALDSGLLRIGRRVEFTHPLVRTAAYRSATAGDRRRVHRALADATDAGTDPDRRAWHRARATEGPDEDVAEELVRSAGRSRARGGIAAAAASLQRAVALSVDPAPRAERALMAAEASFQTGAFHVALDLLATAEEGPLDEFQRARADLGRGQIAFASGHGGDGPALLLLAAARRLEPFDLDLARETYLTAWGAAVNAGRVGEGTILQEICHAIGDLPPPTGAPRPLDLLLGGVARFETDGRAAATPVLQQAAMALTNISQQDVLRWGWATPGVSASVWDDERFCVTSERNVQLIREAGALAQLPHPLTALGLARAATGDFAGAASLISEAEELAAATGSHFAPYTALRLGSLRGSEAETAALIASAIEQTAGGGQAMGSTWANWAGAVLYNGLARYDEAAAAARQASDNAFEPWISVWALPELVEAAARAGDTVNMNSALERLAATTQPSGTDWGLGIEARSRALTIHGPAADALYRDAVDRLNRTRLRPELARAHLLYGEWLRRQGRRVDSRNQLRTAHEMFVTIGMEAFADRARRELLATGETVRKRSVETSMELTPQEDQIARLAREGLSNPEIGAHLFLSARTVEWHLRKVFTKLGISSRRQLRTALTQHGRVVAGIYAEPAPRL
jgi:DNA-binding CsgD family transcriptional regulator/tetratricopeptide (TPR) repeat protein